MDISVLFFLSSGFFLGWTFGANNMSSVFGTAIGTRMISFKTACIIASVVILLGAVISGQGVSTTLQELGQFNTLAGASTTALSAGLSLLIMTKLSIPVSSTQAIVGALIGWNLFEQTTIRWPIVFQIIAGWLISPLIAICFSFLLTYGLKTFLKKHAIALVYQDAYTRLGLLLAGAFCAYFLGANNIGNIMAPFVRVISFEPIQFFGLFSLNSAQILFLLGGIFIAIGIFTYSHRVNETIGNNIFKMSPIEAFIVVLTQGIVLFLFSSTALHQALEKLHLPTFPLVPISNVGAVIGALIGVSLTKKGQGLKINPLLKVMRAWIIVPVISALICFIALFFVENVFKQEVF